MKHTVTGDQMDALATTIHAQGEELESLRTRLEAAEKSLISCRGSVKSDAYAYEKLLKRAPEREAIVQAELNRLYALLDTIDAVIGAKP